ncbi:MAG: M48 family metallopeptidase [Lachnospiraceae bacterium]|nr:M48 family metallopeptidase [Lachnospiraceae bacterium]
MDINVRVIKSGRRTISLEVTPDCEVILRANRLTSRKEIERFIDSKADWINRNVRKAMKLKEERDRAISAGARLLNDEEIAALKRKASKIIPLRVKHYADIIGVEYGRIAIRYQKTRWGSCSGKHNLNFNCLLVNAPDEVLDYVVVHELCHILEMNHSPKFWEEVKKVIPDYKKHRKWLKDNGESLHMVQA